MRYGHPYMVVFRIWRYIEWLKNILVWRSISRVRKSESLTYDGNIHFWRSKISWIEYSELALSKNVLRIVISHFYHELGQMQDVSPKVNTHPFIKGFSQGALTPSPSKWCNFVQKWVKPVIEVSKWLHRCALPICVLICNFWLFVLRLQLRMWSFTEFCI